MAIYHYSANMISRSSGRSSVGAAAYRAGELIKNERDGVTHDYTRKTGIEYSEIMLPENAPQEYQNRATLWNAVEKAEKRKDAQTAREIDVALPAEFSREEQIKILQEYAKDNFINRGMIADICIHDKGDGNPHAHIMLTTREVNPDGFGSKERAWNDRELLNDWREQWAVVCNREFEKKNLPERIDNRTLQAQGIDREPTIHKGATAHQMEKRGKESDRGRINEEVRARNVDYQRDFAELEKMLKDLKARQIQQSAQPQHDAPAIDAGAVRHPDRTDEQATREIQRGGGLVREEYADAKAEELTDTDKARRISAGLSELTPETPEEPTRPKPSGGTSSGDDPDAQELSKEQSPERIAGRLTSLENEYVRAELARVRERQEADKQRQEAQQRENQAERLKRDADNIGRLQNDINSKTSYRNSLGVFKGGEKKRLDAEIQSLTQSKEQAEKTFKRDYGIEPKQADQAVKALKEQAAPSNKGMTMKSWTDRIADLKTGHDSQQAIELEYKKEKALADIHPDSKKIQELVAAARPKHDPGERMAERTARAQAQSTLNSTPTAEQYKKIIQDVAKQNPDKALKILDVAKAKNIPQQTKSHPGRGGMER